MELMDTRWNKIRNEDLTDWKILWDGAKNRYPHPTFWNTLDSKIVAYSFKLPFIFGTIVRILLSIIIVSNRFEPFPIGNNERITNLWSSYPDFIRYIMWKVRNPFEDLRKFYLGFGLALSVEEKIIWHKETEKRKTKLSIWMPKFKEVPFRIPLFPYFKSSPKSGGFQIMLGWKSRGILSLTFRKR